MSELKYTELIPGLEEQERAFDEKMLDLFDCDILESNGEHLVNNNLSDNSRVDVAAFRQLVEDGEKIFLAIAAKGKALYDPRLTQYGETNADQYTKALAFLRGDAGEVGSLRVVVGAMAQKVEAIRKGELAHHERWHPLFRATKKQLHETVGKNAAIIMDSIEKQVRDTSDTSTSGNVLTSPTVRRKT